MDPVLLIIIVIILLLVCGGGWYGYRGGYVGGYGPIGLIVAILVIVVLCKILGVF